MVVLVVAGQRTPRGGRAGRRLQEALVMERQATQLSFEALTVLPLELQHQLGVRVVGGDRRRHAAAEGKPGRARDEPKTWTVRV